MFRGYTAPQNNSQYLNMIMSLLSKVGDTVGGAIKSGQQNSVANQFMKQGNTANAPRAGMVTSGISGVTPQQWSNSTGYPIAGTQPVYPTNASGQLGGTNELQMAMALQKQQSTQQQQDMNMQMHQANMQKLNTENQYLQQYGTPNPGAGRQGSQSQAQTSVWGTANGQAPEWAINNATKVGLANDTSNRVFGVPGDTMLKNPAGQWLPSSSADPNDQQGIKNAQADPKQAIYYVNPAWKAYTGGKNNGVLPADQYRNAISDIQSAGAIHKTMRGHYKGAWDELLQQGAANQNPTTGNTTAQPPPNVAGQGPGKNTTNAPSAFINSVIPQASPTPPAQPNAPAQPGVTPPAGNTGAVIPTVQGNQPPVAQAVPNNPKQTGYMAPGMSIGPTGSPFAGRPGRYLSDGTFMPY